MDDIIRAGNDGVVVRLRQVELGEKALGPDTSVAKDKGLGSAIKGVAGGDKEWCPRRGKGWGRR